ncbi:MAG: response regulator transcription factor [Elusimicrobiota bacterium]|nr:response regulator transcription factor [Elusimicrobiota bacterium]
MTAKVERAGPRRKIVIVDDDVLIRETVRLALDHAGFYVIAVGEPERALAVVRAERPDLVIMDLYMPGFDGRELIRALKSDPEIAKTPVILFSGSDEAIDVVSGLQSGAVEYLGKPIDGEVLLAKINHILKA